MIVVGAGDMVEYPVGIILTVIVAVVGIAVEKFDVRTPSIDTSASSLSGGNKQKLVIAYLKFFHINSFSIDIYDFTV